MKRPILVLFFCFLSQGVWADDRQTALFDLPAKQWVRHTLVDLFNVTAANTQTVRQSRANRLLPSAMKDFHRFLSLSDSDNDLRLESHLDGAVETLRRGVLIQRFYWDIKLPVVMTCEQGLKKQEARVRVVARVVNGVGRVNPATFVIHSLSFAGQNPCDFNRL